jgi:hypothetical protein
MTSEKKFESYTEQEFIEFINKVTDFKNMKSEQQSNELTLQFHRICPHPAGAALIFWPESEGLDSPENIIRIIKEWCEANGKPGFKSD